MASRRNETARILQRQSTPAPALIPPTVVTAPWPVMPRRASTTSIKARAVKSGCVNPTPLPTALNISKLARDHGIARATVRRRLAAGWTPPATPGPGALASLEQEVPLAATPAAAPLAGAARGWPCATMILATIALGLGLLGMAIN